jgi:DNA invertase Pin-like site-specific DNA recombinase
VDSLKRAAFYLRVSTDQQTTDNQGPDLELARARGLDVAAVYAARPAFSMLR